MKQFICILAFLIGSINAAHEVCWRDYVEAEIPFDAFSAGTGLYIGQVPVNGLLPASISSGKKSATAVSDGKVVETDQGVKILCTNNEDNFSWKPITVGNPPNTDRAVRGGIENSKETYIGKVYHENQWKIGKFVPSTRLLNVWTAAGGVATVSEFELLEVN